MSDWRVPLTDISVPEQDVQAVLDCLESGWLTMGPRTEAFERALASFVGVPHAPTVSSGTAALHLSCLAAGLGPGDEVIVPAFTFVASACAARYVGAEPVLCDVRSARDFNLDPEDVVRRITPRTRAVVAVHFCGYPADVAALRGICDEHGLVLIEDCARRSARTSTAMLARSARSASSVRSASSPRSSCAWARVAWSSTADERLAERVRLLRSHAMTSSTWTATAVTTPPTT